MTPDFLNELRSRTKLSTLIGRTVRLAPAGREMRGNCPFHFGSELSFYVNDEKGWYHCYGCSAHGDAIRWTMTHEALPFEDAVASLAAAASLELPVPDADTARKRERANRVREVIRAAADWYADRLRDDGGAEARRLLARSGVEPATADMFGIGRAPDCPDGLRVALARFGDDALVDAGLLVRAEGEMPRDRFRDCLIVPVRDPNGRAVAFSDLAGDAHDLERVRFSGTAASDDCGMFFNVDGAVPAAREAGRVVVVERPRHVIALVQAGIAEAVSPLGPSLTEAHLERLWLMASVPLLCFSDKHAGWTGALRAARRSLPMLAPGRGLAFITAPGGSLLGVVRQDGREAFETLLAQGEPLIDLLWNFEVAARPLDTAERRGDLKRRLDDLAAMIADPHARSEYDDEFNRRLALLASPCPI